MYRDALIGARCFWFALCRTDIAWTVFLTGAVRTLSRWMLLWKLCYVEQLLAELNTAPMSDGCCLGYTVFMKVYCFRYFQKHPESFVKFCRPVAWLYTWLLHRHGFGGVTTLAILVHNIALLAEIMHAVKQSPSDQRNSPKLSKWFGKFRK